MLFIFFMNTIAKQSLMKKGCLSDELHLYAAIAPVN